MLITKYPVGFIYKVIYPNAKLIGGFEGGAIFHAIKDNKHFLIIDEGALADFFDEDDQDLIEQLVKVIEFENEKELNNYLEEHSGRFRKISI
mgnify:CR=1 FL=1|jgi:hypothetical protein